MISSLYRDSKIPCHSLMKPALLLEKAVTHIFSSVTQKGIGVVVELVKRIVLSLLSLLVMIPTAIFTALFAFPVKGVAYAVCHPKKVVDTDQPVKKPSPGQSKSSSPRDSVKGVNPTNSEQVDTDQTNNNPSPGQSSDSSPSSSPRQSPTRVQSLSPGQLPLVVSIAFNKAIEDEIKNDGNCLFQAFLSAAQFNGVSLPVNTPKDLRISAADWMTRQLKKGDIILELQLKNSIEEEWFSRKQKHEAARDGWCAMLSSTDTQLFDATQIPQINARLADLSDKIKQAEANRKRAANAKNYADIQDLGAEYLKEIRTDVADGRIYGSYAHLYAFSKMFPEFPMTIAVYRKDESSYELAAPPFYPIQGSILTVPFLHVDGNHYNLLHLAA